MRKALDGIEATKANGGCSRHRLTHVELVNNRDLPRFAQLDVTADAQVKESKEYG